MGMHAHCLAADRSDKGSLAAPPGIHSLVFTCLPATVMQRLAVAYEQEVVSGGQPWSSVHDP